MRALMYGSHACNRVDRIKKYLDSGWQVDMLPDTSDRDAARAAVAEADALIGIMFEGDLTDAATKLRLIHNTGAGVDMFDFGDLPTGCALCNVYEHEVPIAEYIMLNVLLHVTQQNRYSPTMREGNWAGSGRHDGEFHDEAMGKTLGLVGYGHIGKETAIRAKACGMRVIAVRQTPKPDEHLDWCGDSSQLDQLLAESDFIAVVCPQTDSTQGMIGEAELAKMKPTALLINPARGPIIDEGALFRALKEKRIAGAALDAQYKYPPKLEDIELGWNEPFHELDNVILTPHFSAWTEQMIDRRCQKMAENLNHLLRGEPLERVVHQA